MTVREALIASVPFADTPIGRALLGVMRGVGGCVTVALARIRSLLGDGVERTDCLCAACADAPACIDVTAEPPNG